jgi:hypothetical protein
VLDGGAYGMNVALPWEFYQPGDFTSAIEYTADVVWDALVSDLSKRKIAKIMVLDDGAICLTRVPKSIIGTIPIVGVEQTSHGIKQRIESTFIAEAVVTKLCIKFPLQHCKLRCGVVGLGVIGKAVATKLKALGHDVIVFDKYKLIEDIPFSQNISELIQRSEMIFGFTGEDITENIVIEEFVNEDKFFISCSSKDIEFSSFLKRIEPNCVISTTTTLKNISYACA